MFLFDILIHQFLMVNLFLSFSLLQFQVTRIRAMPAGVCRRWAQTVLIPAMTTTVRHKCVFFFLLLSIQFVYHSPSPPPPPPLPVVTLMTYLIHFVFCSSLARPHAHATSIRVTLPQPLRRDLSKHKSSTNIRITNGISSWRTVRAHETTLNANCQGFTFFPCCRYASCSASS